MGVRRWPLGAAIAAVATVLWVSVTGRVGIAGSHPAYRIVTVAVALGAVAMAIWAVRAGPPDQTSTPRIWASRAMLVALTVATVGVLVYLRPLAADQVAIDALADGGGLAIDESSTRIRMDPGDASSRTGLVFYPGALVDPRAYARILRPVAEAGHPVTIVKHPLNLAILDVRAADSVVGDPDDDVDHWVVGGHSLGGAMAARYAERERDELVGLLLWAAYPAGDLSGREALAVRSVFGTDDAIASPDDIEDSRDDLPPDAELVAVDGAIHSFFGDYGLQRGDGTPGIDRDAAQGQIVASTLDLLEAVSPPG